MPPTPRPGTPAPARPRASRTLLAVASATALLALLPVSAGRASAAPLPSGIPDLATGPLAATAAPPAAGAPARRTGTVHEVVAEHASEAHASSHRLVLQSPAGAVTLLRGPQVRALAGSIGETVRLGGTHDGRGGLRVRTVAPAAALADGDRAAARRTSNATTTSTTGTTGTPTTRRVLAVPVTFADSTATVDPAILRARLFTDTASVAAYYRAASDGALTLTGDVSGPVTVTRSSASSCDYTSWGNAARSAVVAAGVDVASYQHVMYVWPAQGACSWSGMGQVPGSTTWINTAPSLRVLAHELGHNLGEQHASAARCTQDGVTVALPAAGVSCTLSEYGDPFTVMGASSTLLHHNAARQHLGWLDAVTVAAGTSSSHLLSPATSASGTRLLRVPRGDGTALALELRQPDGVFETFAATAPVATGVTVRIDGGTGQRTRLVDTTPATTSFNDAPLPAGASLTDPASGATVTVGSVTASGAQVTVAWPGSTPGDPTPTDPPPSDPPATDTTAPGAVTGLTGTVAKGRTVTLRWTAATDDTGVTGYVVSRTGVADRTTTSTSWSEKVAAGTWTWTVRARDAAGNLGPGASLTLRVR